VKIRQIIVEGATSVLYHKTSIYAALIIVRDGKFHMSSVVGNASEEAMAPRGYPYFMSTTRTKTGDYHRWVGSTSAMFVLDGDKISQHYVVKPVDYYTGDLRNAPGRSRESEDRIFGKINTLSIDCVKELHLLLAEQDDRHSEITRQLLISAKTKGIKTYLYNDANSWRLQDTRKSISMAQAAELLKGHVDPKDRPYMKRPNRGIGRGENAYGRSSLLMWIELIMKKPGQPLSKGADKIRYNLQYYSDMGAQLKNDMFNAKKPDSQEYPLVVKLSNYLTKNKLKINDLVEMLKKKWSTPR
jgi:hypothetical protein